MVELHNKLMRILPVYMALILSITCTATTAKNVIILRAADTHPSDYPTVRAVAYMDELLREWSGDKLQIKLYPGRQLGEEKDTLELTIFGGIDINRINLAVLNAFVPRTLVLGLPFIFRSIEHMRATVDGPIGEEVLEALSPHGLIGLTFYDSGARSFYNTVAPVRSPRDLAGMKIRVQNSDLAVAMVKALGANPTPMGFGQVYEALVLGIVDGSENNWPSYESTRHFEAARYYSLTEHTMTPEILVLSKHRWDKLSALQRALLRKAARASVPYMRKLWDERVQSSRSRVIAAGNQVVDDIDKAAFIALMQPVYEQFLNTADLRELANRIRAVK